MPTYIFKAKKGPEEHVEGRIEALSEKEAIEKISQKGLLPVKIEPESESCPSRQAVPHGAVSSRDITVFTRQLASLLKAGVPILKALRIISEQSASPALRQMLGRVQTEIEQGAVLSGVLSQYPRAFPPLYIAMVRAGEDSGQLPQVLLKISSYRSRQEEMTARFRTAMAYPTLMTVVGAGTVVFMLAFVMPRLTVLYSDMGQALPLPTRIVLAASGFFKQWGLGLAAGGCVCAAAFARFLSTSVGAMFASRVVLSLPVIRGFVIKAEMARFSRTLELLLRSGINILRAIRITLPVLGNELLRKELGASYSDLEQGGSLGKSLKNSRLVPLFMSNLISVGEEAGKLDEALSELADSYERDTDESLKSLGSLMEPAMILLMGLVVGFIVMAMLLPVFEINSMVR